MEKLPTSDAAWRRSLGPERFAVLRQGGTEAPFTGEYWDHHAEGTYRCAGCRAEVFDSGDKFESGSGWPSFVRPHGSDVVALHLDTSHGMERTEVRCSRCGGHLGHVFTDGPQPTGLRYCINSAALDFEG
jgi:peptide-methionine (R)-S-oxide reductase